MRAPRNLPFLLKVYFIVGSVVLVTLALYYNNSLIRRMREQSESTTQLFSKFIAIGLRDIQDLNRREFISEVRNSINLPIVINICKSIEFRASEIRKQPVMIMRTTHTSAAAAGDASPAGT